MPRGARILLKNVCYHIINRGNQKQNIFVENTDFEKYLQLLKYYKKKYSCKVFGYCLMPNHIHIMLEPKQPADLSRFMQCLTQSYTIWFNHKYKKVGHLWQERFKSKLIQKDNYFLDCLYYIETNSVRAGLVSSPINYRWSSYKERALNSKGGLIDLPDST